MRFFKVFSIVLLALSVSACSSKFKTYKGPEVTQVIVFKDARRMLLMHNKQVLKDYRIGLGFRPTDDKKIRGDGRTPEGNYRIDRRNPNSNFYLSIGISYPNANDIAEAKALGQSPGGDIFIHGRPWKDRKGGRDWTAGCIAVTNREMRDIYSMVGNGTPIQINP
ncbi:L,D-transpeptidase family protein [Pelagimonas varians]|uniref:L,D-transpeptidase catalytic domain n=1 Tax=Pelagimonas varians TaxID=696760 RepID=A0A238L354_9RHOB|nr:L,D-transpeptidase family protein [Pelagimonas varians]PYG26582.1 L,D-transpeptidase-like protein [Pelagimonas varians]SMX49449.1 L,D-transpeptidase catalytic domain [Pelagimonas varians]